MIIEKEILINKNINHAWKVLGLDFANAHKWASAVNHSEENGEKLSENICSERACSTTMGNIKERLFEFSSDDYSLAYEVVEGKPKMINYASNTWKLIQIEQNKCMLSIKMDIKPEGIFGKITELILKIKMSKMGQELVEDFKYYVENGTPHPRKSRGSSEVQLKNYLSINALFSVICGLIMVLISAKLNTFFNINNEYVFPVIGTNLIVFSMFVFYVSRKQISNKILVKTITALDVLWVLGSLIIIIFSLFNLSSKGYVLMGIVATWILFLAYKQFVYQKRIV